MIDPWGEFAPAAGANDPWAGFKPVTSFADRFGATAPPANPALQAGLETAARDMTSGGPPTSIPQRLAIDFMNQGSAAGQGTTPIIDAQRKNLISADVYQNDAGEAMFKDSTGQLVPTDQNKHVVLRDPADNTMKVFARTGDTNEGALSSAGRLLMTGMASASPTRLPATATAMRAGPAPSIAELKDAAKGAYTAPEVAGLELKSSTVPSLSQKIQADLNQVGVNDILAPKTFGVLSKLENAPGESFVTASNLQTIRRTFGNAAKSPDPTERMAASQAIKALDEFMASVPENAVIAGDPNKASSLLKEAGGNYAAAKRAEFIDAKVNRAELQADAANSGMNVSNRIRQKLANLSEKELRGYTPDARAKIESIVRGSPAANAVRFAGNTLGGGGGIGGPIVGAIGAVSTPGGIGGLAPLVGVALKKLSNAMTMREVGKLSELIRSNSPLGRQMQDPLSQFAKAAEEYARLRSPSTLASVSVASRNLMNNLRDAGIELRPEEVKRAIGP